MKKFFVVVFVFFATCLAVLGTIVTQWQHSLLAEEENPFFVSAKDFEVDGVNLTQAKVLITLKYIGENPDGLPQYGTNPYDTFNLRIHTDDEDVLLLEKLSPVNNDAYRITLQFSLRSTDDFSLGFQDAAPTKLIIPVGTILGLSSEYTENIGAYTSLTFTSALVLEKYTTENNAEFWHCVETQTYERFYVDLNEKETFNGAYRDENNVLYALVTVPYLATRDAVYDGALTTFHGTDYAAVPKITQEKGTKILRIAFPDSETLVGNMGDVTLTVRGGELTDENLGVQLIVSGERTLYGYADGVFSEDKKIEIRVRDGGKYTVSTVAETEESFVLPKHEGGEGKIFYAWIICGGAYQENATVALSAFVQSGLDVVAEYIDFQLIDGAWICVSEDTGKADIRFRAIITEDVFTKYQENICGVGVIVMPSKFIEDGKDFTLQNYDKLSFMGNYYVEKDKMRLEDGAFAVNATLFDLDAINADNKYSARGYMVMNFGGENVYFWCDERIERTACDLAKAVLNDNKANISEETESVLISYAYSN